MAIEKTVSELAELFGVSRQAVNNRVKALPEEDLAKNDKGVTVVTESGIKKLEDIYNKIILEEQTPQEEKLIEEKAAVSTDLLELLVSEKNQEITRLYEQLKAKDAQLSNMDEQLRVKDVQISEKDKQLDQQQQLTLAAMEDKKTLALELDEAKAEVEEIQTQQEEINKGFFARIFGKK